MSVNPRVVIVNDVKTCIPGTKTLWHWLVEWFDAVWCGGGYSTLSSTAMDSLDGVIPVSVVIRNGTYFPYFPTPNNAPIISLIQDIQPHGSYLREWQTCVCHHSAVVVFNSEHTRDHYPELRSKGVVIPLGVDFDHFKPDPRAEKKYDVCWVGAGTAIKGWTTFQRITQENPQLQFVCVTKDGEEFWGDNVTFFHHLTQDEMVRMYNKCQVGLCTSQQESQHLAGIEMAACGLTVVAPPVGVYAKQPEWSEPVNDPADYAYRLRFVLEHRYVKPIVNRVSALADGLDLEACKRDWVNLVNRLVADHGK